MGPVRPGRKMALFIGLSAHTISENRAPTSRADAAPSGPGAALAVLQHPIQHLPAGDEVAQDALELLPVQRVVLGGRGPALAAAERVEKIVLGIDEAEIDAVVLGRRRR